MFNGLFGVCVPWRCRIDVAVYLASLITFLTRRIAPSFGSRYKYSTVSRSIVSCQRFKPKRHDAYGTKAEESVCR